MKEFSDEEREELHEKYTQDLINLTCYFKSMDYDLERIKIVISLLLATLGAADKIDEEDLRDMFRIISKVKDRIVFK